MLNSIYHLIAKGIGVSDSLFWTMYCLCEEEGKKFCKRYMVHILNADHISMAKKLWGE